MSVERKETKEDTVVGDALTSLQSHAMTAAEKFNLLPGKCKRCREGTERVFSFARVASTNNRKRRKKGRPSSMDIKGRPDLHVSPLVVTKEQRENLDIFKRFLEIKTISAEGPSTGAYAEAVAYLSGVAKRQKFDDVEIVELVKNKPILLCTFKGRDPTLPSILLNSHYDVVPANESMWTVPPFRATESENGDIYARGSQDMKCVCVQHMLAVGRIIASGTRPLRTLYLTFVPDEEIGGAEGLGTFVKSERFKKMNVGCGLDEGLASPDDKMTVFHGERAVWWCRVEARGNAGHGSRFVKGTAVPKLLKVLSKIQAFRAAEEAKLTQNTCGSHHHNTTLGDVTSINITMLEAGVKTTIDEKTGVQNYAFNVIPDVARAGFDTRIPPNVPLKRYKDMIDGWAAEEGVTWKFENVVPEHFVTNIDDEWWTTFKSAVPQAVPEIFPAGTDARFIRELGIPAFGFSPMNYTPILLHDHDEFLNARVFLDGIGIFVRLITALANIKRTKSETQDLP